MLDVVRLIALRSMSAAKARTALTISGIVLGVAVVFAIHVLNRSVMASFRKAVEDVSGKTSLVVGRGTGLAEEQLEQIRAVPGVKAAAPVIEDTLSDEQHHVVLALLGIDGAADREVRDYESVASDVKVEDELVFLNDPHGILISRTFAERHALHVGDVLPLAGPLGKHDYTVRGLLSPKGPAQVFGGDLVVMDVFAAQLALGRGRRFDRVDVVLDKDQNVDAIATRLEQALEHKASVTRPEQRTEEAERLLASFKLALSLTSLVAIFVGAFIVYNALAIAVAQRRRDIGVLRALGMTRSAVRALFVGEGMLMGLLGALLGIGVGLGLARLALQIVGDTVSAIYVKVQPEALSVDAEDVILAAALGFVASTLAAWFPAQRAAGVEPILAMQRRSDPGDVSFTSVRSAGVAAGVTLGFAAVFGCVAHRFELAMLGHTVSALIAFAVAFAAPVISASVGKLGEALVGKLGPSALLGSLSFRRDAGRSSVAIAALGMALANVIAIDALLGSMKSSTHAWLGRAFRADLFVLAGTDVRAKFDHPMPASLEKELFADPDVAFVQSFRMAQQTFRGTPFYLMSEDLRGYVEYSELSVAEGDFKEAYGALRRGESVGISQAFARSFGMHVGDTLPLQTAQGPRNFRVDLVYVDYRTDAGAVLIERSVFTSAFADELVDLYGVYLKPGSDAVAARARIARGSPATLKLLVLEHKAYMEELVGLIDRSLALSHAGEAVAILVAVLGMLNTLAVSVLDRKNELGTLRAVGASRTQVKRVVLTESLLMALSASLVGTAMGVLLSAYNVRESLRFQLGWQLDLSLSLKVVLAVFVIAQLVGLVSALLPMRSAADVNTADALASE